MMLLSLGLGYLMGSVPFSYIMARLAKGVDIRKVGTRNVGAHNVMVEAGRLPGLVALALDVGKGAVAVELARRLWPGYAAALLAGLGAILGHDFPFLLGFRGGRGLATSWGIALSLLPQEGLLAGVVMLVLWIGTRSTSFGALVSYLLLALLALLFHRPLPLVLAPLALLAVLGLRQLPEARSMWVGAKDKRELLLSKWIVNREGKL